jgi:arabinose-5-phosphate isomerase
MVSGDIQHNILDIARSVLETEAASISSLVEQLDEGFEKAVEIMLDAKGHVVVMGLGKSGHVGRRLAATLASTGTPAFFVHAAEALHGDLGMITNKDVVLAISNSGETEEILRILPTIRRMGTKVISMTADRDSNLGRMSDAVLKCRVEREADPLNLAPTSSSAASLAMGDALAVALMSVRGTTSRDFHRLHPGGSLGKKLAGSACNVVPE